MLPLRWTIATPSTPTLRPLRLPGSLTARLSRRGEVSVEVLFSGWDQARPDEAAALGLRGPGQRLYAREVCIGLDGAPTILARSVTSIPGIKGPWKALRHLGRKPLADLLWAQPLIGRGPFEYTRLPAGDGKPALPARRSCFCLQGEKLIVLEAFVSLPWPGADA